MSSTERPAKRARLEADKRRAALAKVQDKYADIDFTRFQKVVAADAAGEATPHRFVLVRPVETALVKDWRQWSSYEGAGETLDEGELAHLCTTGRQRRHYTGPFGCTVQSNLPAPGWWLAARGLVQGPSQRQARLLELRRGHGGGTLGQACAGNAAALSMPGTNSNLGGGKPASVAR